jgi:hypothetical protein
MDSFGKSAKEVDHGLLQLDVKAHTLGFIFLLFARCSFSMDDGAIEFMNRCQQLFASGARDQARMELKRLARIVHKYTSLCSELQVPMRGILPLEKSIRLLSSEDHELTPAHADILQLCLLSKNYTRAGRMLSASPILQIRYE